MTFALIPYRELAQREFGEIGLPTAYADGPNGEFAVGCAYTFLYWPARAIYDGHRLQQRVVIYDRDRRRIGCCDDARFPILDLSLHPSEPVVAIATGAYDGGYAYEGALHIYNWKTGESYPVFQGSRFVERCYFEADGSLSIAMRPGTNEEPDDRRYYAIVRNLKQIDEEPAFEIPPRPDRATALHARGIAVGSKIWDLAWTPDDRLAAAYDDGRLELWDAAEGRLEHTLRPGHKAVQLLRQPDRLLVHALDERLGSHLFALAGDKLEPFASFRGGANCSVDNAGRILARDTTRTRRDRVLSADGAVELETDLGAYDAFNHAVRIDGEAALLFLRGDPAGQHTNKTLCSLDTANLVYPEEPWDTTPGTHLMCGSALFVRDDLVLSARDYKSAEMFIERRGKWRHRVAGLAASLVRWHAANAIVAALVDGTLCILDADSGAVLHHEPFVLDGLPTVPISLAVRDDTIAIGTISGRIAMFALR